MQQMKTINHHQKLERNELIQWATLERYFVLADEYHRRVWKSPPPPSTKQACVCADSCCVRAPSSSLQQALVTRPGLPPYSSNQ